MAIRIVFLLYLALTSFQSVADAFVRFEEQGKIGLKDESGKVLLPASFEALGWSDGSFSVIGQVTGYKLKGQWGVVDLQKKFITAADFESLTYPGGDHIIASRKLNPFTVKFGCLDLNGRVTVPFNYDGISIHGLRAIVFVKNGAKFEYGMIDLNDRGVIPLRFRHIHPVGTLRYGVENFDQKMALFSEEGVQMTDFVIDSISSFHNNRAIVYQNLSQGIIDREGTMKAAPAYREVKFTGDDKVLVRDFDEWKMLDDHNQGHEKIMADLVEKCSPGNYRVTVAGKTGVLDNQWKVSMNIAYDYVGKENNGLRVVGQNRLFGLMRRDHSWILPLSFDSLVLEGNFVRAQQWMNGRKSWTLYDTFGIRKTTSPYDLIASGNEKFFPAKKRGYWGAVNRYGEEFIKCVFDSLMEKKGDLLAVKFRGQYGIIDQQEKWLLAPQRNPVILINENCYLERVDTITFLRNFSHETIYFTTLPVYRASDHLTVIEGNGAERKIGFDGLEVDPAKASISAGIQIVSSESEGYSTIRKDGKYGFVDSRGRLRIANRYDGAGDFHEGLAPIKLIGKWGFVDTGDQVVVNPNFESVGRFMDHVSIVRQNGKAGLIDPTGKVVLPIRYDSIRRLDDHSFLLELSREQRLFGLADQKGNVLIEPRFDHFAVLDNGYVIAGRDGKSGLLTRDGFSVIPMIYDALFFDSGRNQYLSLKKSLWKEWQPD